MPESKLRAGQAQTFGGIFIEAGCAGRIRTHYCFVRNSIAGLRVWLGSFSVDSRGWRIEDHDLWISSG